MMKTLFYDAAGLRLREMAPPVVGPGEALIRVELAGVCRTDLEIAAGYMGFTGVLGHEFVGVVRECAAREWVGRRVVGEINLNCGRCSDCARGLGRHCPHRTVLGIMGKDGAFAEFLNLPVANLHPVPETMSNQTAVFVEPVAAAFEILEQVELAGRRVAVLGDGKLGIIASRVIASAGVETTLVGKHADKLARGRSGPVRACLLTEFLEQTSDPERKYDVVVEATGRPEGFGAALAAVRPRGTIVQKTTVAAEAKVDLARVVIDEIAVIGSRCGPFPPALRALAAGAVMVEDLIDGCYPLSQGVEAIAAAGKPGALKVLISMEGDAVAGVA
jgi:threonine dehydrogenase-like Zn-dependent dehydrogenase